MRELSEQREARRLRRGLGMGGGVAHQHWGTGQVQRSEKENLLWGDEMG